MTSIFKRKGRKGYALKFRDPSTLRERTRQFSTKTDAQTFDTHVRAKLLASEGLEQDIPFAEYATDWLRINRVAVRRNTHRNYEWIVRMHLVPVFGTTSLRNITPRMVRELAGRLRLKMTRGSVSTVLSALHSCLESAVEDQIIPSNPARMRSKSKLMGPAEAPSIKAMTVEQAQRFLAAAPEVAPRQHMLFRTILFTGLRPGEASALQPHDLDFASGRIRLERTVTMSGQIEPCKTDNEGQFHHVDMPDGLARALKEWKPPPSSWLFPGKDVQPMGNRTLGRAFRRVLRAAGLPTHFTPHCLRHTYATQLLIAGESVYYVMRQLRHSDIRITVKTYGSWLPAGNRATANKLEERLLAVTKMSPAPGEQDAQGEK